MLVGARGFEPPTSCSQSRRATRLRYAPILRLSWRKYLSLEIKKININLVAQAFAIILKWIKRLHGSGFGPIYRVWQFP